MWAALKGEYGGHNPGKYGPIGCQDDHVRTVLTRAKQNQKNSGRGTKKIPSHHGAKDAQKPECLHFNLWARLETKNAYFDAGISEAGPKKEARHPRCSETKNPYARIERFLVLFRWSNIGALSLLGP